MILNKCFQHKTSGGYLWIEDRPSPQFDSNGKFIGYVGTAHDITERKAVDDAIRHTKMLCEIALEVEENNDARPKAKQSREGS